MTLKWVEVSVTLIDDTHPHEDVRAYTQRINYDYFQQNKPSMVAEIAAVVNDLQMPRIELAPMSPDEINLAFDKEYALHKERG